MHKPESVQENIKKYKIVWDFEIHLISTRRPDLAIVNKKKKKERTSRKVNFAVPADHRVKLKESEKSLLEN